MASEHVELPVVEESLSPILRILAQLDKDAPWDKGGLDLAKVDQLRAKIPNEDMYPITHLMGVLQKHDQDVEASVDYIFSIAHPPPEDSATLKVQLLRTQKLLHQMQDAIASHYEAYHDEVHFSTEKIEDVELYQHYCSLPWKDIADCFKLQ